MHWHIDHRFGELEGRDHTVVTPGSRGKWLRRVMESIEFQLDKNGAELTTMAFSELARAPMNFSFGGPFLIVMQKRDARQPFFVTWVDNAELLQRWPNPL
jgi:hypothetical protein